MARTSSARPPKTRRLVRVLPSAASASPGSSPGPRSRMKPIVSRKIDYEGIQFHGIDEFLDLTRQSQHIEYTVSWIDCVSTGKNFARGVFMQGDHSEDPRRTQAITRTQARLPLRRPWLRPQRLHRQRLQHGLLPQADEAPRYRAPGLRALLLPARQGPHWNRLYGKSGLLQFQYAIPWESAREGTIAILSEVAKSGLASFPRRPQGLWRRPIARLDELPPTRHHARARLPHKARTSASRSSSASPT